jgi:hypothetical protein
MNKVFPFKEKYGYILIMEDLTLKDIQEQIDNLVLRHGDKVKEYKIVMECVTGFDLETKMKPESSWSTFIDKEDWIWINVISGFIFIDHDKRIIGFAANY